MGDPIIDAEIRNYLKKEIGIKTHELKENIQDLTEIVERQQKVIETLQKKVRQNKNILNTCLCNTCKNKLGCQLKPW